MPRRVDFAGLGLCLMVPLMVGSGCSSAQPREAERPSAGCPVNATGATVRPFPSGLSEVPADRRAVLSRGVNVTNLLGPPSGWPVEETFQRLRGVGIRHVRIPVAPELFSDPPPDWQAVAWQRLDTAVCAAVAVGLGVIIDLHPLHPLEPVGGSNEAIAAHLAAIWRELAERYAAVSPDLVFFEIMNEPKMSDGKEWEALQDSMLRVIRAVAPRNTVVLTASPWSTAAALSALTPSSDPNVVYTFHFYTPMIFTHQSAEWALPDFGSVRGLAYPARPGNVASVERDAAPALRPVLSAYAKDFANSTVIAAEMDIAADWSRHHGTTVIATEFGVYDRAAPASRAAWLQDVRQAFEQRHIGWTVWEYEGGFGIGDDLQQGCTAPGSTATALALCGR